MSECNPFFVPGYYRVLFNHVPGGPDDPAIFVELENEHGESLGDEFACWSWTGRDDGLAALIIGRDPLVDKLGKALADLLQACWHADAQGELPAEVDGSLMDAARIALDEIPDYAWRSR